MRSPWGDLVPSREEAIEAAAEVALDAMIRIASVRALVDAGVDPAEAELIAADPTRWVISGD